MALLDTTSSAVERGDHRRRGSTNGQADPTSEFMSAVSCGDQITDVSPGRAIRDTTIPGVAFDMSKSATHVGDDFKLLRPWLLPRWKKQPIVVGAGGLFDIKCRLTIGGRGRSGPLRSQRSMTPRTYSKRARAKVADAAEALVHVMSDFETQFQQSWRSNCCARQKTRRRHIILLSRRQAGSLPTRRVRAQCGGGTERGL